MIAPEFLAMAIFGFKSKKGEVLNHWIAFVDGFNHPPQDFYSEVERQLAARRIPSMEITRVEFAEGGLLSDKRIYLRMLRERLAFDTCAAPFGNGYFFSCRTVYIPPVVRLWHIALLAMFFLLVYSLLVELLGVAFAAIALATLLVAIVQVFQNAIALGLADLDNALIKTPVIGPIYERWFRKETYYRQDTRLVYLEVIPKLIKELAEHVTAAKGARLIPQFEHAPVLGELYRPVTPSPATENPK